MHFAILSQYYPPETGAPQRRLSELVQHLVHSGHKVTVCTAMPNYPQGRIFDGYGGFYKRGQEHGAEIVRTFIYSSNSAKLLPRLSCYCSFMLSSAMAGSFALNKPDYLFVESPPLFLGLSGYWLSRIKSSRLIFNVADLWPDSAVRLGIISSDSVGHRVGKVVERFCYRKAWLVSGQSKSILRDVEERFPKVRTFHLSNGVDTSFFDPQRHAPDQLFSQEGAFVALYAGLHGLAQGLDQVLAAAAMPETQDMRFVLVGDGPCKAALRAQAAEQRLSNVQFLDTRTASGIPRLLAGADVLLVTLKTDLPGAVPSKLYEAMAMAKPIILVGTGEAAEIVREWDAGIVVEPGRTGALAAALRRLRSQPDLRRHFGENGRRAALMRYNRATIARKFITFLESELEKQRVPENIPLHAHDK